MPFEASIAIMCGGRGRRLGNLTKEIPKPLVKLNGKTILEWKLEHYANQSYFDNILCIGYQGEKIKKHIKPRFNHVNFNNSGTKAGILKRLFDVRDKLQPISIISLLL